MKPINRGHETLVYENQFFDIKHSEADFGEFRKNYYVINFGPRTGVVAVRDGAILMVRQYRFFADIISLEIPGGALEEGEAPAQALTRECLEETGILCKSLNPLIVYYPGLDNVDNRTTLFFTEDIEDTGTAKPDSGEVLEVEWIDIDECLDMIFREEIKDALTIAGVMSYYVHKTRQTGS